MAWTEPQQAAIDKRNADILVSAAAGSGKTAVLTERVINRITGSDTEESIALDRFLIVTFTSAAANEMKERITHKLSDKIADMQSEIFESGEPKAVEKIAYLEKQIALVQTASISTIHSFCLKVIKTYFHQLDIDPNIKVGGEAELAIMKMDILQEIIEEKFDEEDVDFLRVAEIYGSVHGMAPLINLILDIDTFSKSTPFPEAWLNEKVQLLCTNYTTLEHMPWSRAIKESILNQLKDIQILYKEALLLCIKPNGPELYQSILEEEMRQVQVVLSKKLLSEIVKEIQAITFANLPRKKQECDETLKENVKLYRNLAKDSIKSIQEELDFITDELLLGQLPKVGSLMKTIAELIKEFEIRYQAAKQDAGIVDYNDLEHLCLKVLVVPEFSETGTLERVIYTDAAKELSRFYREIYIDEYQDSNTVQEMILNALTEAHLENSPTRFMVGDMKQSIYRFRLANPLIFANKYASWEKHLPQQKSEAKQVCIDLSQNFRSRANILHGINEIFEQLMSREVGELEYDDNAKLKVGNLYQIEAQECEKIIPANAIELHVLETQEENLSLAEEDELESLKSAEIEAILTATLVDKLLKGEGNPTHIVDKETNEYRKIEPRDIVILLRATKDKAMLYENALIAKGIGAYADVSSSFFDAIEIQTILALLKIIDNPYQDIPLLTVLRSPIVGASLDDLVLIRQSEETGYFYEALKTHCTKKEAKGSIKDFWQKLLEYRNQCSYLTLEELIAKLYAETGYYRYVTMHASGAKKGANLELLKKYACEFENSQNGKLFNFLQYLDRLRETSDSLGEAKLIGNHENLVRIMSIHKSKGLEFSIVFLCDAAKRFNQSDLTKSVLLHSELGLAPDFMDSYKHVKYTTIPKIAVKNQITAENISEEMRVLYVALTRAKEKLFIVGTVSNFMQKAKNWALFAAREQKEILPLGVKKAGSYLNWIGLSLYAHPSFSKVREAVGIASNYALDAESKWVFKLWHKAELAEETKQTTQNGESKKYLLANWDATKSYGAYKDEIYKRLSFQYPYTEAAMLPTKLSVSEIKNRTVQKMHSHALFEVQENKRVPQFVSNEQQIKGAKRGTLIHSVFEQLDFLKYTTKKTIGEEIDRLIDAKKLQQEVLQVIDLSRLAEAASSEIVQRMRDAKHVWKEKQFVYLARARSIDLSYPEGEHILVQGIVDTFFVEEDGIVIVDYKTDYIDLNRKDQSIQFIKERYQSQLQLYAQALGEITKQPVKEKWIYLYAVNKWIQM